MSVLVFADITKGISKAAKEAVYYGNQVAGALGVGCNVVTLGDASGSAGELGKFGATKVLAVQKSETDNQQLTWLVVAAGETTQATVIIFTHDHLGKAVAPRVAARLNAGFISGAIALPETSNGFVVKVNAFSGKAFAHMRVNTDKKVISLLANSLQPVEGSNACQVESFAPELGSAAITLKEVLSEGGALPLPEAELVVSGGRGLKGPEFWGILEELAGALGAATACSRPVADMHWRPHHEHVGQTGVAIRPNLYIAAGISGAIQHLAGVNGSKVIVVINTDKEAPFFKAADYGVLGDAFEVLPRLTEAVKKFKSSQS